MFHLLVGARFKARADQAVMIGWHAENFRRSGKGMKNLEEYLKPPEDPREADLRRLVAVLDRMSDAAGDD